LLYSKHHREGERSVLTGNIGGRFIELELLTDHTFDRDGPILVRDRADAPWLTEVAVLESDHFAIRERILPAIDARFGPIGRQLALAAQKGDRAALRMLGEYLLYQIGDFTTARIYLEAAYARGDVEVLYDLAIIALFHLR
jgi:hypothetical protein